jgi:hypothetical protein
MAAIMQGILVGVAFFGMFMLIVVIFAAIIELFDGK